MISKTLTLSEEKVAALTTSMRQVGVGAPGGAEALAIFHQLLYDEWMTGSLSGPLARIEADKKKLLWDDRLDDGARGAVPVSPQAHSSSVKHRNVSFVKHEGLSPMPKD